MYFDETAWVAIAFILFFVLVWKRGKKAILSLLDERSLLIEKELNEAKSLKEEALEELRLALQNQKNVSDEAENLINNISPDAEKNQDYVSVRSEVEIFKNAKNNPISNKQEEELKENIMLERKNG